MKKKIFTILILLCTIIAFSAFTLPSAFANGLLIEDGYYPFESPFYLHASESVTVVGKNKIYVIDPDSNVIEYEKTADKAIYEKGKLYTLVDGNLFMDDVLIASSVIDFDVNGNKFAYIDADTVYTCLDAGNAEIAPVNYAGFSSVAISGNGLFLKKDMGAYDEVHFYDFATKTLDLRYGHLKKFDSLIFDTKIWGVDGNVIYDIDKNVKKTVSPYANAVSVFNNEEYYVADGCLYKGDKFILGSGNDFYYPTAIDSNANGIYTVDENGVSEYVYKNGKFVKASSITDNASNVAVTVLPNVKVYYSVDTDVYPDDSNISLEDSIVDIATDCNGSVYSTTANATYQNSDKLYDIGGMIAIAPSKKDVYVFNGTLYKNGNATTLTRENVISFDVDGNGNVYLLTKNGIECYDNTYALTKTVAHNAKEAVDLDISYEVNTLGQIAVVDKAGHNVHFVDADVYIPSFTVENTDEEMIRSITSDTPVFKDLNRSEIICTLSASSVVLCSAFELECDDYLAYVSFKNGNSLVSGYVRKDGLSSAYSGETPRYKTASTIYDNVILHSHPYGLQEADNMLVQIIASLNTEISLISKYTVFGEDWYKAEYNGAVGYVSASQIQLGAYVPTVHPDTNAKLVKISAVYDKVNGKFVEDDIFLAVGTEVQVLGVFDSNTTYTQIKYYDGEAGGTRTCYVKTDALKYDYVTFEQQFALIAIIVLSISTIIVIVIFVNNKRKAK